MHVGGLPALHHRLAHDLQVCVALIVAGGSVVPGGLAVLPLGEYGLGGRAHVVVMQAAVRFSAQKRVRLEDPGAYIGTRSADTAGVPLRVNWRFPPERQDRPRSAGETMIHSEADRRGAGPGWPPDGPRMPPRHPSGAPAAGTFDLGRWSWATET